MGQKVNPIGLRLGVNKTWQSRWYADPREYADLVLEDIKIRKMVSELPECKNADIAEIEIVRHPQRVTIVIHTARPGVIIGVKGASIEKISADIQKQLTKKVQIKIKEIKRADLNASLIAQNIGRQLSGTKEVIWPVHRMLIIFWRKNSKGSTLEQLPIWITLKAIW